MHLLDHHFSGGMESLQEEAPYKLFGNEGSIPQLSSVLRIEFDTVSFAEM